MKSSKTCLLSFYSIAFLISVEISLGEGETREGFAPDSLKGLGIRYSLEDDSSTRMRNDGMDEDIVPHLPKDNKWTKWNKANEDNLMFVMSPMIFKPFSEQTSIEYHYSRTGPSTGRLETHTINGNGGGQIWLFFDGKNRGRAYASTSNRHFSFQYKSLRFELFTPQKDEDGCIENTMHDGPMGLGYELIPGLPEVAPKLDPATEIKAIPKAFHGTWTHNPSGKHPKDGEDPTVIKKNSIRGHESHAEVQGVQVHGPRFITIHLVQASEAMISKSIEHMWLSENGNQIHCSIISSEWLPDDGKEIRFDKDSESWDRSERILYRVK